jgi:hypothetical protein
MTNPGVDMESVAEQVGRQGIDKLVTDAERVCVHEQRRIALENEPAIVRLTGEGAILAAEERRIADRLTLAPPPGDLRCLRWKRVYYWVLVALLAATGFFSTLLSFAPFRLGWMSWLVSAGIAMLTPFLVDHLLENPGMEKVLRVLTAVAAMASLACLMVLAVVRGNLLAQQIRESETQTVIIDDAQPQAETPNTFYDRTTELLCAALLLMAFATETGGGLVLHAAWRSMPNGSEDWAALRHKLVEVRGRLAAIAGEVTMLRNAPEAFAARYWRDFYRALLLGATRSAMTKLLLVFLAALTLAAPRVHAQDHLNLVIAIDLTRSVAAVGPDGKSDFQKNVEGVTRVLAQVPAGARLTVIGITDRSFAEPYILMRAQIPDDSGYFGERLGAARSRILSAWNQKSARLSPRFAQTDIFGALELASQLFDEDQSANRKELVIFSDMRESVPGMDFERLKLMPAYQAIEDRFGETISLRNVHVYVAGVDGAGKSVPYWKSLNRFWGECFRNTGATLESFAVLPELSQVR